VGVATTSSTLTTLLERITIKDMAETNKVKDSKAKQEFAELIEIYKKQNPVKYAAKKAELERKLAQL